MRLKAFFILLLTLAYMVAPVFDAVACNDCADPVPTHQRAGDNLQSLPDLALHAGHDDGEASPIRGTAKDLCPLCANAVVGITPVQRTAPFETMQRINCPKLLAFSDPSYPINKPPQN